VVADEIVPKLEAENQLLQANTTKLADQLEETERRLEEERNTRLAVEETRDLKIREVQASWSAVLEEKQNNWDSRERSLEERADNQERLLKELKASYEVTQRLERGEEADGNIGQGTASTAELEMITSDLERANLRLAEVEARNEQLRLDLAQSAVHQGIYTKPTAVEDDPAFLRLRSENSSLLRKVDSGRIEREAEKREWEVASRNLRKELAALREDTTTLRTKINSWRDYPDVKRELEILKSVEFATGDPDDFTNNEDKVRDSENTARNPTNNLEQLLLARNKKLNDELTVLRVSHQNLSSRLDALQEELSSTNMELEKARNLTATLENDLAKIQNESSSYHPAMSVAGTYTSRYPSMSYASRRGRISPTSSIISGIDPSPSSPMSALDSIRAGEPVGGGSGILPMVAAQRDRFKKRVNELDTELAKSYQTVSSLRSEIASLQKDNLNLYEKTRYVSSYSKTEPNTSSNAYTTNPNPSTIQILDSNTSATDRYKSAYESKISPFAAFRSRESARAFKRMSLPERGILQVTKFVLATRTSRNLFALYLLTLHLLLFGMLFSTGGSETGSLSDHVPDLGENILAGAAAAADSKLLPEA